MTDMVSIKPIALFRHGDYVVFFLDSALGRSFLNSVSMLDRESIGELFGSVLAEHNGDLAEINGTEDGSMPTGVVMALLERTSLPRDMPNHLIVGMSKEFEGMAPKWNSSL